MRDRDRVIKAFMCGTAWAHELGETDVTTWPTAEALRRRRLCVDECGIVEVEVRFKRWVRGPKAK